MKNKGVQVGAINEMQITRQFSPRTRLSIKDRSRLGRIRWRRRSGVGAILKSIIDFSMGLNPPLLTGDSQYIQQKINMKARLSLTQQNCTLLLNKNTHLALPNCMHNIISPIPTYPRPTASLDLPSEISEQMRDHSNGNQTIDNTINFQQVSSFHKWQEPPCNQCKIEAPSFEDYIQLPHYSRKSATAQNLKNISRYIRNLVQRNHNLSIKQLSYLLYEIIGETSFGKQLLYQDYVLTSSDILQSLSSKYSNQRQINSGDQSMRLIIKNVRRRLYDAINVLIAAGVLQKCKSNILRIAEKDTEGSIVKVQDSNHEYSDVVLKYELRTKLKKLQNKRNVLKEMKEKYGLILKLQKRNSSQLYSSNIEKEDRIELPVMVVDMASKMRLSLSREWLSMVSLAEIGVRTDLDVVGAIFREEADDWLIGEKREQVIKPC